MFLSAVIFGVLRKEKKPAFFVAGQAYLADFGIIAYLLVVTIVHLARQ